jgi:hypothetical protein
VDRGEQTLLVGWIAIATVVLEALALAAAVVVWGVPALIVGGPVLLASVIVTVVLWLTVVAPQRLLRAHLEGWLPPGAPAGRRAAQDLRGSRSGSGSDSTASGSAWPSDSGFAAGHAMHHGGHGPSESGWSADSSTGDGTSSGSWSDSTSSGWSDSSSSSSSDSSSSSSSDSSSSSW